MRRLTRPCEGCGDLHCDCIQKAIEVFDLGIIARMDMTEAINSRIKEAHSHSRRQTLYEHCVSQNIIFL
jgi:hypothetical protein